MSRRPTSAVPLLKGVLFFAVLAGLGSAQGCLTQPVQFAGQSVNFNLWFQLTNRSTSAYNLWVEPLDGTFANGQIPKPTETNVAVGATRQLQAPINVKVGDVQVYTVAAGCNSTQSATKQVSITASEDKPNVTVRSTWDGKALTAPTIDYTAPQ